MACIMMASCRNGLSQPLYVILELGVERPEPRYWCQSRIMQSDVDTWWTRWYEDDHEIVMPIRAWGSPVSW